MDTSAPQQTTELLVNGHSLLQSGEESYSKQSLGLNWNAFAVKGISQCLNVNCLQHNEVVSLCHYPTYNLVHQSSTSLCAGDHSQQHHEEEFCHRIGMPFQCKEFHKV